MAIAMFNPQKLRVVRFEQRLRDRGQLGMSSAIYEFDVTLALSDAEGPGFGIETLSFTASGGTAEPNTMHETIGMFLDAITAALQAAHGNTLPSKP